MMVELSGCCTAEPTPARNSAPRIAQNPGAVPSARNAAAATRVPSASRLRSPKRSATRPAGIWKAAIAGRGGAGAGDGVSGDSGGGEPGALVGEAGCGKSVSALSVMRLVDEPAGRIESGEIVYKGRDLLKLSE